MKVEIHVGAMNDSLRHTIWIVEGGNIMVTYYCRAGVGSILVAVFLAGCEWFEQPGPRLRRECASLVDEVLKQDQKVPTSDLEAEFSNLPGGTLPNLAPNPREEDYRPRTGDRDVWEWAEWITNNNPQPGSSRAKYLAAMEAYKASVKAREAKLEELMKQHPEVWDRLFQQRRDKAINECIVAKAKKEGVVDP